jgi:alcohol dehydrogenase, propanol-preferring
LFLQLSHQGALMKSYVVREPGPVETRPLQMVETEIPKPKTGEVLIKVSACGVCRTDLQVAEGDLPLRKKRVIPGHQVVGWIVDTGDPADRSKIGTRVGLPWLRHTCGVCQYCISGRENLCGNSDLTGYSVDGGFAEYVVAPTESVFPLPNSLGDSQAAPLLCAGIIGFRCLRMTGLTNGGALGIYGFGAVAHVTIQVARHWGISVYVCTRNEAHQHLARDLGAAWAGEQAEEPPVELDAAIIFAPAGELVIPALKSLKRGGTLVLGGIYMTPIPSMPYELLYGERCIRTVTNYTSEDVRDFLKIAAAIPIHPRVKLFPWEQANEALLALKDDEIQGAAVLTVD